MSALSMLTGDPLRQLIAARTPQLSGPAADVLGQGAAQQAAPAIPLLPPDEQESALTRLGHAGLGALHFLGSTLDKTFGGRAIRGVLGGRPEELASVIPLSDQLGITSEDNRVSGEDLLKNAGLLGPRDDAQGWLQLRDLAGPAVEMALDPATYLTLGTGSALTEAGEQAAKEGTLAATGAGRVAQGQAGLAGLGLPFSKPSVVLGTGPAAQKIAGGLDSLADRAAYSYPGRALSMLFDKRVGGTFTEGAQREARAMAGAAPAAQAAAKAEYLKVGNPLLDAGMLATPEKAAQTSDALTAVLEGRASPLAATAEGQAMTASSAAAREVMDARRAAGLAAGRPIGEVENYAPRQMTPLEQAAKGYGPAGGQDFPTASPNAKSRLDALRDLPKSVINDMSVDPAISGPGRGLQNGQDYIRHNYLAGSPAEDQELLDFRARPPQQQALSRAEQDAVEFYRDAGHEAINDVLRGTQARANQLRGAAPDEQFLRQTVIPALDAAIERRPLASDLEVYRGAARHTPGDPGYTSVTTDRATAEAFARNNGGTVESMTLPKGTRALPVDGTEGEYLLPRGWSPDAPVPPPGPSGNPDYGRWQALEAKQKQSEDLAEIMAGMDPQRAATADAAGKPLFANNQLSDIGSYLMHDARAQQGALARHNILAAGAAVGQPTDETVSALDALDAAGLNNNTAAMQGGTMTGGQAALLDALRSKGVNVNDLAGVRISKGALADAVGYGSRGFQAPPAIRPIVDAYDSLTNLTKGWMSSFWPSSIARDELTGVWQHAATGVGGPVDALTHQAAADTLRSGKTLEGAAKDYFPAAAGLSDEEASRMLRDEMFVQGAWGGHGQASDAVGLGTHEKPGGPLLPNAPDAAREPLLREANPLNAVPRSLAEANPLDVRGVGGRADTGNSLVGYGQNLRDSIYETQAGGTYLSLRRQGFSPAEAAKRSLAANYDYSNLTPFESQVMRRLMPFYSWSRQNVPNQVGQLLARPGGMAGAAIRGTDDLRSRRFAPDYVNEGVGVPVGAEADGTQRFLTELGLPWEDVPDLLAGGPNPLARAAEKQLGNLNPLLKAPLEYATGKQFYSDRDLADLHGLEPTGNPAIDTAVNQAVMNSPAQRFYGLYHTLADPRKDLATKALNELAPTKVTDVDMGKARSISARDLIEGALRGNPNVRQFTELYVRPQDAPNLTPEQLRMMELYKTLEAAQSKKGRTR